MSLGDEMLKGGVVVPKVIGWGVVATAVVAIIGGVNAYNDLTNQVSALDARLRTMEAQTQPTQGTLLTIQTSLVRLETRIDLLLQERRNTPAGTPYP